ncbi:MAG: heme-binding protein [Chloroflexi bacterium]|nr:heme-binding protein [Chloroflexota bacterium]MDA1269840.1 heme-binding protein [Chloroflexota bacterium]
MALTLSDANRMVAAAIAEAERMNIKLSVSVCDAGGHLLAFNRMEGAIFISAVAAQGKAVGAVGFGRDSSAIPADSPVVQAIMATQNGRIIPAQGALAIIQDGVVIGAIGGSGGTSQQDEDCARVGLAAL